MKATDGFSEVSDKFTISVKGSFAFYAEFISSILGPIVSVLALYKYRILLYNLLCQKKYQYSRPDELKANCPFSKSIPLIKEDFEHTYILWELLEKEITKKWKRKKTKNKKNWFEDFFYGKE